MKKPAALDWRAKLRSLAPCVYACIGTDRSTGDSLGPLVGTLLMDAGIPNVYGHLGSLLHAGEIEGMAPRIKAAAKTAGLPLLAIDAALGGYDSVGKVRLCDGPVRPGAGVRKDLPPIGDYHLVGTVNVGGFMEYVVLQNTPLGRVYGMAQEIVQEIVAVHAMSEVAAGKGAAR